MTGLLQAIFGDIRRDEFPRAFALMFNLFLLLVAYYIIKTVREPLVLASGSAELKSYAAAGQAVVLIGFVPIYSWISNAVTRERLIVGVTSFFIACILAFYPQTVASSRVADAIDDGTAVAESVVGSASSLAEELSVSLGVEGAEDDVPQEDRGVPLSSFLSVGFIFYVWVGIFSVAMIAQFWSFANDLYPTSAGERIFPMIAVGATVGAAFGSYIAAQLFRAGLGPPEMLLVCAGILALHAVISVAISRASGGEGLGEGAPQAGSTFSSAGGFALVLRNRFITLLALLLILLNIVNTTGEYILSRTVVAQADALLAAGEIEDKGAFIGAFYGEFFFYVNIATILIQAVLVARIVKYVGIRGVVFALPIVAFGAYGLIAMGAGFSAIRVAKSAENSTDYSVMNTAKAMLWLPLTREEKYKAKQAIDTFFVRLGDMISAGIVAVGTGALALSVRGFAVLNLGVIALWLAVAWMVTQRYRSLTAEASSNTSTSEP